MSYFLEDRRKDISKYINNDIFNIFANVKINPNSKKMFEDYGSRVTSQTIATELPKFKFLNKDLENKFHSFLYKNNFLKIFQKLEECLFINGIYCIGIIKNKIVLGKPVTWEISDDLELIKLDVNISTRDEGQYKINEFLSFDLTKETNYIKKTITKSINNNLDSVIEEDCLLNTFSFIPFVIFENNASNKPDVDSVEKSKFDVLDIANKFLHKDMFMAAPILGANEQTLKRLAAAFSNEDARLFQQDSLTSWQVGEPVNLLQAQSNVSNLILVKNNLISEIKFFMQLPKDTSQLGTKNLQTEEVKNINADFDKLIQTKANLREWSLSKFVEIFCKLNNFEYNPLDVDITVYNSTKYKKQEEVKNIILQNSNFSNSSELIQNLNINGETN